MKKTINADLEHRRPAWFLIGLAVASAFFVVALELSFKDDGNYLEGDFLDEIAEDMELMPPLEDTFMEEPETPVANQTDLLEVVEKVEAAEESEEENVTTPEIVTEEEVVEEQKEEELKVDTPVDEVEDEVKALNEIDELPVFPGGNAQLIKWLTQNLKYPESAKNDKVGGKVIVEFVVNANGSVSDVKLVKNVEPRLDSEALRVVRMMPVWKAGMLGGKPCRTLVKLPIVFKL
ncbi:MAG: energy transducer TonB [Prevotella sp.]|nr:energy transducer TonB [Prevotella sp.]